MTDYDKLAKALRCGSDGKLPCDNKECPYWVDQWHGIGLCNILKKQSDAAAAIEDLQAQLPKRGEWVEENRRPRSSQFVCSECHRTAYDPQPTRDKTWKKRCRYAYCPNCGAKMEVHDGYAVRAGNLPLPVAHSGVPHKEG